MEPILALLVSWFWISGMTAFPLLTHWCFTTRCFN